jgi:hypothetical protein
MYPNFDYLCPPVGKTFSFPSETSLLAAAKRT